MPRVIWKGAISFGLVHVPVALYPASQEIGIDFDWLDRRSMDPVGYKRVNKRTGREIALDDIVKGIKQDHGDYVVLSDEEIKAAYPVSTRTIEIERFVPASEIAFTYLERPYYLAPIGRGDKVYALLRDAIAAAGVIGIARVVMHNKERLAALIADGEALLLNTLRWSEEIRPRSEIAFPPAGKGAAKPKEGEMRMAVRLIRDMSGAWRPSDYADKFTHAIHALAAQRVKAGGTERVTTLEGNATPATSNVVDLAELLKKSLAARKPAAHRAKADAAPTQASAGRAVGRKATPAKAAKAAKAANAARARRAA
jgi:DNA end-binding protein Ku